MAQPTVPNTPVARRQLIAQLLSAQAVGSQSKLEALLAEHGLEVTQATLSRDLDEIGAVKVRGAAGNLVYAVPDSESAVQEVSPGRLARLCEELLVSAQPSGNLAVIHTPPGAAQFFASTIDQSNIDGVIGTIAGDDTILLITASPAGGEEITGYLTGLAERNPKTGS